MLAPAVEQVLAQAGRAPADLTGVAVGTGPGPFTGLRVGLVTAQALAEALGVPAHGVCTLDVLAAEAVALGAVDGPFVVATDARRREVYWAAYDAAGERTDGPHVDLPASVPVDGRPVVGRGASLYPEHLGGDPADPIGPLDPSAAGLADLVVRRLARGDDLSDLSPRYLRRPDVHEAGPRKSVLT
nr:tRNA (adenosine(37)-N6)-threonylcarbamoyltransferase complex dimerization subunit type 1 TsaB [Angustibacter aerolatus]